MLSCEIENTRQGYIATGADDEAVLWLLTGDDFTPHTESIKIKS